MVNAVVRTVLLEVCVLQDAQHGLVWAAGDKNKVFYAYGICIAGRIPNWVKMILTAVV